MKQMLMDTKGEVNAKTITGGGFNTPLTSMDGSAMEVLNDTINQLDLIDRYRTSQPIKPEYKLFSSSQGTFSGTDQTPGHEMHLNKFMMTSVISSIFFCLFLPQWYETRNQPQKEKCEKNKHMVNKQHATKTTMGKNKIKEEIKVFQNKLKLQ